MQSKAPNLSVLVETIALPGIVDFEHSWRAAAEEAAHAYRAWGAARRAGRDDAYATYRAAEEREAAAAESLRAQARA